MSRLDELRDELHRVIHSMEFAYAMGARQTIGDDPRLDHVLDRVAALRREIAAEEEGGGSSPPPSPPSRDR